MMNSTARKRAAEAASATEPPLSQPNGSEAAPSATAPQIAPQPATALDRIMDWALSRASGVTKAWLVPAGDEVRAELDRANATIAAVRALADDPKRHLVRWIDDSHLVDLMDLRAALATTESKEDDQ